MRSGKGNIGAFGIGSNTLYGYSSLSDLQGTLSLSEAFYGMHSLYDYIKDKLGSSLSLHIEDIIVSKEGAWQLKDNIEISIKNSDESNSLLFRLLDITCSVINKQRRLVSIPMGTPKYVHKVSIRELSSPLFTDYLLHVMFNEIFYDRNYYHNACVINEGDIVVDIGANIGLFSIFALEEGAGKVYAFEPNPNNFKCLLENTYGKCYTFNLGVSDKLGFSDLYEDVNTGGHSLYNYNGDNTKTGFKYKVPIIKLDNLFESGEIPYIDFLKIDTEGAEYNILKAASDDTLNRINKISMEFHHMVFGSREPSEEIIQRLSKWFNFYRLDFSDGHTSMIYFWKK